MSNYIAAFALGLVLDLLFTWYITAAGLGNKLRAGLYSVGAACVSVFGTISIYDNRWLAVPYFLGLFCGTVLALSLNEKTPGDAVSSEVEKAMKDV